MVQFILSVKLFKAFLLCYAELNENMKIFVKKDGWEYTSMDGSHIALIHAKLDPDEFQDYNFDKDFEVTLSCSKKLKLFLKSLKSDFCKIDFNYIDKKYSISAIQNDIEIEFNESFIDFEYDEINVESLKSMEYDNKFELSIPILSQLVDCESEILQVNQTNNQLQLTTDSIIKIAHDSKIESNCNFAIAFIKRVLTSYNQLFNKQSKSFKTAIIQFNYKSECPAYFMTKLENYKLQFEYYIAPRVEEDKNEDKEDKTESNLLSVIYSHDSIVQYLESEKQSLQQQQSQTKNEIASIRNAQQILTNVVNEINYNFTKCFSQVDLIDIAKCKYSQLELQQKNEAKLTELICNNDSIIHEIADIDHDLANMN